MKLREAVKTEDRLTMLKTLRDMLAGWLDACDSGRDQASLSRQFVQITAEIAAVEKEQGSAVESLNDFRAKLKVAK